MKINSSKTKEIILGAFARSNPPDLVISGNVISRVLSFKLLGIHISNDLSWNTHMDAVYAKATTRLFLIFQTIKESWHFYLSDCHTEHILCVYTHTHYYITSI